ncbi:uncharacterized protein [Apostichopus japonicus]|uniref:uncharacterized protein isoform X2 n=1 Tax=Stichopus japonicus TaxID=307972 RepID=UPI003AB7522A
MKKAKISINMWSLISAMLPCFIFLQRHIMASQSVELIKVPPVMSLSKDGNYISDAIWLEENKFFSITCHALNSKPRVNLTWDSSIIEDRNITTWNSFTTGSQLFNSTSVIEYRVGKSSDTLTCSAGFEDGQIQWNTSIFIMSYESAPPPTTTTPSSVKNFTSATKTTRPDDNSLQMIIGVSLVIAILLIFSPITFAILWNELRGHRTMTSPTDQRAQGNIRPLPLALISRELPPIYDQTDMINDGML